MLPTQSPSQGSSSSTGPQAGQGAGQGPAAREEATTSRREHISPSGLDPRSQIVGSFLTEGPSEKGEVTIQKGGALEKAVRELSQEVEREPLPIEQREQVERFYQSILGERREASTEESAGTSEGVGGSAEKGAQPGEK